MTSPPGGDDAVRTRLVWTMFVANAVSSTAFIASATVAPIVAESLTGDAVLAGLPSTAATVGTAAGALALGAAGARFGRRRSFAVGFALAAAGAGAAVAAATAGSAIGFALGLLVLGFGRSVSQLARYVAGDLRPEHRRARAIGVVVWASTVGAVLGPLLIAPAGRLATSVGLTEDLGPVAFGSALFLLCALVVAVALRPEPLTLVVPDRVREQTQLTPVAVRPTGAPTSAGTVDEPRPVDRRLAVLRRTPTVRLSVTVLVTSQLVMVLVMTMTPLHIRGAGQELGAVGVVMAAHTLGMFALAPVTGWLVDRVGPRPVMVAGGIVLLLSCALAATAGGDDAFVLITSLFGLGYGWNLGFVAASSELQHGLAPAERARVQGVADATTWLAGGIGAGISGVVLATVGYTGVALLGGALTFAIPMAVTAAARAGSSPEQGSDRRHGRLPGAD